MSRLVKYNIIPIYSTLKICMCYTLKSWLHKIKTRNWIFSLDWNTTIKWNVVPKEFQLDHICHGCWKVSEQYFNAFLFSNPGENVRILVESRGQICPVVIPFFYIVPWIREQQYIEMLVCIFPTTLTYMVMLENCKNTISTYGCSPIQGTRF